MRDVAVRPTGGGEPLRGCYRKGRARRVALPAKDGTAMREARAKAVSAREGGRGIPARTFPLAARAARGAEPSWKVWALVVPVLVVIAFVVRDPWEKATAVAGAAMASYVVMRLRRPTHDTTDAEAWITLDDDELARVRSASRSNPRGRTSLARWDAPFGVSVLANAARTRALLAFTTPSATRFLPLFLSTPKDADDARELMARAITVSDVDLDFAAGPAPDAMLHASAARDLVGEITKRDPQALARLYLSDANGVAVVVEREKLVIGERVFDLASPVEWRVFTFHEGDPAVATFYQATSVRQGGNEVVLVCRTTADVASWSLGRAPDAPPARETRVAIDSLFMTPLRAVLAQAPRVSRPGPPPSRSRGRAIEKT
jgi:hypothetical protein